MSATDDADEALALAHDALERGEVEPAVAHLSAAIRHLTALDDPCRAAMACVQLGGVLANAMGNLTASRAWFHRAWRLVRDRPPCLEQGWVAVAALGCDVDDPAELLAAAELALDRARRFGDVNLETKALADAGLARVQAGSVAEGMSLLDEAMALACGPADDVDTAAKSVCSFFTACYYAADFERAGSWSGLLRQQGLISGAPGGPVFLSSHCDSVQATLLLELGRWGEAETVLTRAKAGFEEAMNAPSWHPDIALADLRTRQGRLADAEALLLGKEQAIQALLPAARLHLARGDHDLARAVTRRGLRVVRDDRLRVVELLTVLVETELAREDLDAAADAAAELAQRIDALDIPALTARAAPTRARAFVAVAGFGEAIAALESALDRIATTTLHWLHLMVLIELARVREQAADTLGASLDAEAATALLAQLDVVLAPADTALLQRLAPQPTPELEPVRSAVLGRHGTWWTASFEGTSVRLRDTKGLRYLGELLAQPGTERHVLDLVDRVEGVAPAGGPDRRTLGHAGEALDSQARDAYRHRIEALRWAAADALAAGLLETAEAKQDEIDALVAELAKAFGLGGRSRVAASAAERARLNVTRALRSATGRLADGLPEAGTALDRGLRTGLYCAYEPSDNDGVRWSFTVE
jgi:tetratricopeptide (TPR) repeat protein